MSESYMKSTIASYNIDKSLVSADKSNLYIELPANSENKIGANLQKLINDLKNGSFARKQKRILFWKITLPGKDITMGNKGEGFVHITIANENISPIPKKLYHWTDRSNMNSILNYGLEPKSTTFYYSASDSEAKYPYTAIFLTSDTTRISKLRGFAKYKKNKKMALFEITLPSNITLYKDSNLDRAVRYEFSSENKFFFVVFDKIPKQNIKLVFPAKPED